MSFLPSSASPSPNQSSQLRLRVLALAGALVVFSTSALSAQTPAGVNAASIPAARSAALAADYGKLPLSFEANQGQTDSHVKFLSRGNGYSLFLTDKAAVLELTKNEPSKAENFKSAARAKSTVAAKEPAKPRKTDVIRMELAGASQSAQVTGTEQLPGTANYFIGNDSSKWHTNVPTYAKVKYAGVYPGVDLVYYGNQSQLEYDFVVAPKADPKTVQLHFAGADKLKLAADGDLIVAAKDGEIAFHKPVVYQALNGQRQTVDGSFTLLAKNTVGFTLGSYDRSRELVIDPTLAYSTYFGSQTGIAGIAADAEGNTYLTGGSYGLSGTTGPYHFFIAKMNPQGSALVYTAILGSEVSDAGANGIAVDASGNVYLAGSTFGSDYPVTSGAFQQTARGLVNGGTNAFVTKLNPTGTALVYSTYLGGSDASGEDGNGDVGNAIAVDGSGNAYVTGTAWSADFPVTQGAFQTKNKAASKHRSNGFVSKFNATGTALIYSTYLGGSGGVTGYTSSGKGRYTGDVLYSIALDTTGNAYVVGRAWSRDFPVTPGVVQATWPYPEEIDFAGSVSKINARGTGLVYSSFLPGGASSVGIAVDSSGDAYLAGDSGHTFPVSSTAFEKSYKVNFVAKLNPQASGFLYATYLGGSRSDSVTGIALDQSGDAYVAGIASSSDFPVTADAYQAKPKHYGNSFLTKFNATGSALLYSTYLGGGNGNNTTVLAVDPSGNAYLAGNTDTVSFPTTPGSFEPTAPKKLFDPFTAGFLAKFEFTTLDFGGGFLGDEGPIQFNGSTTLNGPRLQLTNGLTYEIASAFSAAPVNIESFTTNFEFQLSGTDLDTPPYLADGITFTIQNAGATALGTKGGGLGYAGIGKSVAIKFDLHSDAGEGDNSTGLYIDGAAPTVPALDLNGNNSGINLQNGHIFDANLAYDGTNLVLTITDTVTKKAYTHSFAIDIPATVGGNTAYVGFTGATGALIATQDILNWTFTNP
jgi:hypothetical protein